ncbi:MAG: hypothetical protein JJ864_11565 [Rhizobiaceae bacterium]|nr:hypothetical protein [Rhizobiaceae bacterium]
MFLTGTPKPRAGLKSAIALSALFAVSPVAAHDALPTSAKPQGWSYPITCCSGYDCREVSHSQIKEGPEGYVIASTGELIPMTDRKVRPSPDGEFHWCSVAGKDDGRTICLFVPPRAF